MRTQLQSLPARWLLLAPLGLAMVAPSCAVDGCTLSEYASDSRCTGIPPSDITLLTNRLAKAGGRLSVQVKNLASGVRVTATLGPAGSGGPAVTFTMNSDGSGFADIAASLLATIPAGPLNVTIQAGDKSLSRPIHIFIPASFTDAQKATATSAKGQPVAVHAALGHAFFYEEATGKGVVEEYSLTGTTLVVQSTRQAFFNLFNAGTAIDLADGASGSPGQVVSFASSGGGTFSLDFASLDAFPPYTNLKMLTYTKGWAVAVDRKGTLVAVAGEGTDGPLKVFTLPAAGQQSAAVALTGAPSTKQPVALAWGDLDGDSLADLVALHSGDNSLAVYRQKAGPGLTYDANLSAALQATAALQSALPVAMAMGDVDQDGLDDLVFGQNLQIMQIASEGSGTFTKNLFMGIGTAADALAVGDVNGDGKPDLIVGQKAASLLVVYPNQAP